MSTVSCLCTRGVHGSGRPQRRCVFQIGAVVKISCAPRHAVVLQQHLAHVSSAGTTPPTIRYHCHWTPGAERCHDSPEAFSCHVVFSENRCGATHTCGYVAASHTRWIKYGLPSYPSYGPQEMPTHSWTKLVRHTSSVPSNTDTLSHLPPALPSSLPCPDRWNPRTGRCHKRIAHVEL